MFINICDKLVEKKRKNNSVVWGKTKDCFLESSSKVFPSVFQKHEA